jgi:hypothetical protein
MADTRSMRPVSVRLLRRSAVVVATLLAGGASAVTISDGATSAAAQDIPVYTSTTPEVVTAPPIDPFEAAKIEFYKSTQIKKLPPAPTIRKLRSRGWGITVPARCTALCVYAGTLIARNVGIWYSDAYAFSAQAPARDKAKPKEITLGTVKITGTGDLSPKVTIRRAFRCRLLRARRPVRLTLTQKVTDSQHGFVTERTQKITLRPGRR